MSKVCILDYGSGNVKSVFNILQFLNLNPVVSNRATDIANATHIILPGVGAFGASMEKIAKNIPINSLESEV
jgi:glutamine amidotransferase